jgi:hypothetical protein
MARFVKKLGTAALRYMFEMTLHTVDLRVPQNMEVQVGVVLRRGNKRMESKLEPVITKDNPVANFKNEKLTIVCSVYKDKATGQVQER